MNDTPVQPEPTQPESGRDERPPRTGVMAYVKLARVSQWSKSGFVLVGPAYSYAQNRQDGPMFEVGAVLWAALAFSLASSGLYVINDLFDRERDRHHPRKRRRPIASGAVSPRAGVVFAAALIAGAIGATLMLPYLHTILVVGALVLMHIGNVLVYSAYLKHKVILDVLSLAMGFVFRVLAGCAAAEIEPSTWLLNATLFLSMFLAFGKRLGERRTLGDDAASARKVQAGYSDVLLQMSVVVTAVATLMTYAGYVQSRETEFMVPFGTAPNEIETGGFRLNLLWLTVLPATLALFRTLTQLERGTYDDPTELAIHDSVVRICGVGFVGLTILAFLYGIP